MNTELQRMAALVIEIDRLRHEFQPMPDDVMEHLTVAFFDLEAEVMATPARSMEDIAAKLRMLAAANCSEDGFYPAFPGWLATVYEEVEAISQDQFGAPAGMEAAQ